MTMPCHRSVFAALVIGAGFALAGTTPALAQSDPATRQLIERLTPPSATRGIRVPGSGDAAAAAPAQQAPVQPAPVFAPPGQAQQPAVPPPSPGPATSGSVVAGPVVAPPPVSAPPAGGKPADPRARAPAPARDTTAPTGVAAASISVFFPSGSAVLTPEAERALAPLGQALTSAQLASFRFRIEGHTDTVGDPAMNQVLSERRAAAVREYLIRRWGVSPERLQAVGLGESQLLVPTPDETPAPRNRRVQVVNLDS